MPVDPRLNCAAEICCPPAPFTGEEPVSESRAHAARAAILRDLGLDERAAHRVATNMSKQELCFMPQALANTIREVAFPDGYLRLEPFMETPGEPTG